MARGRFITFEGIDGCGKSTQVRALAARLRAAGHSVVETREPGGAPGAEAIRRLLVEGETGRWSAETEILLFTAARRDHLERLIEPALAQRRHGDLRPVRRFHPRLPGRRARRPARHRGRAAPADDRHRARPDAAARPRPGDRRRAWCSRAAASRTVSNASARPSRRGCATGSWRSPPNFPPASASCRPRAPPKRSPRASPRWSRHERGPTRASPTDWRARRIRARRWRSTARPPPRRGFWTRSTPAGCRMAG